MENLKEAYKSELEVRYERKRYYVNNLFIEIYVTESSSRLQFPVRSKHHTFFYEKARRNV